MNSLSRRKSPIALPFNKIQSPSTFKNHHRQKVKKTVKRLEVEVAEMRGYTKRMKELAMEEATVLGIAVEEIEAKVNEMKRKKKIVSWKNRIINRFITGMLAVFEAEDQHVNLIP